MQVRFTLTLESPGSLAIVSVAKSGYVRRCRALWPAMLPDAGTARTYPLSCVPYYSNAYFGSGAAGSLPVKRRGNGGREHQ